ncbi:FecR domain-containing protein [Parasphingorhabdus litoris]|uniref:FecR domain-containing protein n=1 Tax=Parasphingorhabdus litoris TaxID=394733 RepID=UPI001E2D0A71|nr:FecR domain-containing protein [Parasphingorhabdus litoris]
MTQIVFLQAIAAQPVKRAAPLSGKITATKGGEQATLLPRKNWQKAVRQQDLKAGDVLRTRAAGTLAIVFVDGTQVRLGRNSVMVVRRVSRRGASTLSLQRGKAWGRSPRNRTNLSIETPSATAAIRGTEWAIEADADSSRLQVFSGAVELSNEQGGLIVEAGQAATVLRGQAPTRTLLVNPTGREQMLYFVNLASGLDLLNNDSENFVSARRSAVSGDWEGALRLFEQMTLSTNTADQLAGVYGSYVAMIQLGNAPSQPLLEDSAESYLVLALIDAYEGDLRAAKDSAQTGIQNFPNYVPLYQVKANVETLLGDPDTAFDTIANAREAFPDNITLTIGEADLMRDYRGKPKAARDLLAPVIAANPDNFLAQKSQAKNWMAIGGLKEAGQLVDQALGARPYDAEMVSMRAEILLQQNRLSAAKSEIDKALEMDPGNALAGNALAQYWRRKDRLDQALDASLAASAHNPDYGMGFLGLAQVHHEMGETGLAEQQFDTADRLDPLNPAIALARTGVALQDFAADNAIRNAREALNRYRGRGGEYVNLSENRETGSLVSQAFRFLDLEGWGRYYADRVFDSFTPSSYFDQAINQTPGPFLIRNPDGSYNAQQAAVGSEQGESFEALSSFLQGVALDPLSVASSQRRLRFDNGNFFEPFVGTALLSEELRNERVIGGGLDTIFDAPLPTAIWMRGNYTDISDERRRPDISPFSRRRGGDSWFLSSYVGLEITPSDSIVLNGELNRNSSLSESNIVSILDNGFDLEEDRETERNFLFGLYNHKFGYRDQLTIGGGFGRSQLNLITLDLSSTLPFADQLSQSRSTFRYLSANYAKGFGPLDLRIGGEWSDVKTRDLNSVFDFEQNIADPNLVPDRVDVRTKEARAYLDLRYHPIEPLVMQGQMEIIARTIAGDTRYPLNFRLGASYEPIEGQWLRAAFLRQSRGLFDFSFRPAAVVGLQANSAPSFRESRNDSFIMRWDAEWSDQFFTTVEYQDQQLEAITYAIPDLPVDITGFPVSVKRISAEANLWLPGNIGLRASYAYTDSAIEGSFVSGDNVNQAIGPTFGCATADLNLSFGCTYEVGDKLPFVPGHFARASLVWSLPAPVRLKASISGSYIGGQRDDLGLSIEDAALVDARLEWEPLDQRLAINLSLLNLLDKRYDSATSVAAPRLTVVIGAEVRF